MGSAPQAIRAHAPKRSSALDAFEHECGRKARTRERACPDDEQRLYHDGPPQIQSTRQVLARRKSPLKRESSRGVPVSA